MGIKVTRTSKDETRVELCREILSELFGTECALVAWVSGYADSTEALYVWDFMSAENAIPQDLEPPKSSKQWFVIHRKDLPALKEAVGTANLHGLLKPVTRGALGAFLSGASPSKMNRMTTPLDLRARCESNAMTCFSSWSSQISGCRKTTMSGTTSWRAPSTIFVRR